MTLIFGWVAIFFSLTYKVPQMYILCKEKKHEGLSINSILWQSIGYVFYIVHGVFIEDWPILIMGSVALVQSIIITILYWIYKDN
tara:strand:- start:377 stop:631 length:255 start_codon:yes stop_codon:yes gene_type:complete